MRNLVTEDKADIMVSELLGSFGDNELSPECLDGAQVHLKPDGIMIPNRSTSYLSPVMAPKLLYVETELLKKLVYAKIPIDAHITYLRNVYHIADPQSVFTFVHPNREEVIDYNRSIQLEFDVKIDCVMTGFAGYFDTVLFKNIKLSIHRLAHTTGLISWHPMYFSLDEPQQLRAGDKICVDFRRCVSPNSVWYEWRTTSPFVSKIHNFNGECCSIQKH